MPFSFQSAAVMPPSTSIICVFICSGYLAVLCLGLDMGKAQIVFKYAEVCPGVKTAWNFSMKTSKKSRNLHVFSFSVNAKEPIDKKIKIDTTVSIWSNGGWKPNFYKFRVSDICNSVKTNLKKMMIQMAKDSNFTVGCPVRAGPILLKNYPMDMREYVHQTILPYAKLMAISYIIRENQKLACTQAFMDIVPDK